MNHRRVLVTGSRDWDDANTVQDALWLTFSPDTVLVSGHCRQGADALAESFWKQWGGWVELYPAQGGEYGKSAGFIRNKLMVDLGADVCLAFVRNGSRGTMMTAALAEQSGIPVRMYYYQEKT